MKAKQVLDLLKIHRVTLNRYVRENKIKIVVLPNGRYDYNDDDVFKLAGKIKQRKSIIYTRVSTNKQKNDLQNQLEILRNYCMNKGIIVSHEISDISSGMSLDRPGIQKLLDLVQEYEVDKIFITYKDRLARISYDIIESICKRYGTEIVILNYTDDAKIIEKELLSEIISLLHCFSMKQYSERRKNKLKLIQKDLELENDFDH